ncbi:MAG: hypothetical protein KGJ58_04525 [Patescibacteria group bacterium]|nr:hypothetical protein [Patescibacteria group bacterium]
MKNLLPAKKRTSQQNKSLHLWLTMLADEFNERGIGMRKILKPHIDIPPTAQILKDNLWRPVQEVMLGKKSTKDLTTGDIDKVFDVINRHIAQTHKIHIPFPSLEELAKSERFLKPKNK